MPAKLGQKAHNLLSFASEASRTELHEPMLENYTIAVENSTWNNIGDAFYQMSLERALRDAFPDANVVPLDGPVGRAFRTRSRRARDNALDIRNRIECDHIVLSGPILSRGFLDAYAPLIRAAHERGISYSLVSVHAYAEGADLEALRAFFNDYPPAALHTRDHYTYEKLKGVSRVSKSGMCFAFFVNRIPHIPDFGHGRDFACISFHSRPEPTIKAESLDDLFARAPDFGTTMSPRKWRLKRHFDFLGKHPSTVAGLDIVRPVHGFYPFGHLTFSRPGSFISYNPRMFLAAYKACSATITDRVHAAVATLSYGKAACLQKLDARATLFDAAPVTSKNGWMTLDPEALEDAYQKQIDWLRRDFAQGLVEGRTRS